MTELAESPSPSSQKEVASLVTWLREQAEIYEDFLQSRSGSRRLRHVANLLEKTMPEPVAVSERLPGTEDLDSDGRCWWFHPIAEEWCFDRTINGVPLSGWTHWLPFHALPLPALENEK